MQQRYYDPAIGAFLSVDPAKVNTSTAANFGRYYYATDNPYRFTDPDGRAPAGCGGKTGCVPDERRKRDAPKGCGTTRSCVRLDKSRRWVTVRSAGEAANMIAAAERKYSPDTYGAVATYDPRLSAGGQRESTDEFKVGPSAFDDVGTLASVMKHEGLHIAQYKENRFSTMT
jgi:hypothetical protein